MSNHYKNLVFEGGGVKGVAYVGAMEVLEKHKVLTGIQRVGGTSAGSIQAMLLALGYNVAEIRQILWEMDFESFRDDSWGIFRNLLRVRNRYGWYKGDAAFKWIRQRVDKQTGNPNVTFQELQALAKQNGWPSLYVVGTDLSKGMVQIYSHEETPDTSVAEAVRISMSIPLFFASMKWQNQVMVDGGVLQNYPVRLFDRARYIDQHGKDTDDYQALNKSMQRTGGDRLVFNQETLGFRLDSAAQIKDFRRGEVPGMNPIRNVKDYMENLVKTLLDFQDRQYINSDDWERTIHIDTLGVRSIDFSLSEKKKKELVQSGITGTTKFFDWKAQQTQPVATVTP